MTTRSRLPEDFGATTTTTAAHRRIAALAGGAPRPAAGEPGAVRSGWVPGDAVRPDPVPGDPVHSDPVRPDAVPGDPVRDGHQRAADGVESAGAEDDASLAGRLARSGTWGVLAEKWVPETLREARVNPGRRGATVLALVAAVAAVVAAVGVWWSRPQPAVVPSSGVVPSAVVMAGSGASGGGNDAPAGAGPGPGAAAAGTAADTAPGSSPSPSAAPTGPIVVSVTGDVRRPGLVTVPAGSRVADAIAAAGGALDEADLTGLNLAARLADGSSVVISDQGHSRVDAGAAGTGLHAAASGGEGAGGGATTVNINDADVSALQQLPGVGPVTAQAIVSYRDRHGRFTDVQELQAVSGIGPATLARIAPHVTT